MEYRKLPHGGEPISILGLGTSSIQEAGEKEIEETISYAVEQGINYFDMASAEAKPFPAYGRALSGVRDQVHFQIHFGADYTSGTYGWTTDPDIIKRSVIGTFAPHDAEGTCVYCNHRCPFHVDQIAQMKEIREWFK